MNKSNLFVGAIAIIALVLGFIAIIEDEVSLGSATHFSGPIDSEEGFTVDDTEIIGGTGNLTIVGESNLDTLIYGGDVWTTTTAVAATLTAAHICDNSYIKIDLDTPGGLNVTLPATTTLHADCLLTDGDTKSITIENVTSTLDYGFTLIAGAGIDLLGTAATSDVVTSTDTVLIEFIRISSATTTGKLTTFITAD